mgnify:CR=1 FL=1|jgi:hypothetical protein
MVEKRVLVTDSDFEAALRLSRKIALLIQRKGKKCISTYLALKIILLDMEHDLGISLAPEDEQLLKDFLRRLDHGC